MIAVLSGELYVHERNEATIRVHVHVHVHCIQRKTEPMIETLIHMYMYNVHVQCNIPPIVGVCVFTQNNVQCTVYIHMYNVALKSMRPVHKQHCLVN